MLPVVLPLAQQNTHPLAPCAAPHPPEKSTASWLTAVTAASHSRREKAATSRPPSRMLPPLAG